MSTSKNPFRDISQSEEQLFARAAAERLRDPRELPGTRYVDPRYRGRFLPEFTSGPVLAGLGDRKIRPEEVLLRRTWDEIRAEGVVYERPLLGTRKGRLVRFQPPINYFGPEVLAGLDRRLTSRQRRRLPARVFALPGRRFPLLDCNHARNALARASMSRNMGHLSQSQYNTVVRKAHAAMRRLCR